MRGSLIPGWSPVGRGNGRKHSLSDGRDAVDVAVAEVVFPAGRGNGGKHSLLDGSDVIEVAVAEVVCSAGRENGQIHSLLAAPGNCAVNVQSCFNVCIIMRVGEKILHIANLLNNLLTDSCDGQPHSMWQREHYDSQTFKRI